MDFAVERHKQLKQQEEEEKQRILDSKLKPKGPLLLKESSEEKADTKWLVLKV